MAHRRIYWQGIARQNNQNKFMVYLWTSQEMNKKHRRNIATLTVTEWKDNTSECGCHWIHQVLLLKLVTQYEWNVSSNLSWGCQRSPRNRKTARNISKSSTKIRQKPKNRTKMEEIPNRRNFWNRKTASNFWENRKAAQKIASNRRKPPTPPLIVLIDRINSPIHKYVKNPLGKCHELDLNSPIIFVLFGKFSTSSWTSSYQYISVHKLWLKTSASLRLLYIPIRWMEKPTARQLRQLKIIGICSLNATQQNPILQFMNQFTVTESKFQHKYNQMEHLKETRREVNCEVCVWPTMVVIEPLCFTPSQTLCR